MTCGTLGVYAAAVRFDEMFHDGEAEAGPTGGPRARRINAVKTLEHPRKVIRRDSCSRVANSEQHSTILCP